MVSILKKMSLSFSYAVIGVKKTFKSEFMFRLYCVLYLVAFVLAIIARFSLMKIGMVILCGSGVLMAELLNTGIEKAVDALGKKNEMAAFAKDAAAGGVAVFAMSGGIVIVILFIDNFLRG